MPRPTDAGAWSTLLLARLRACRRLQDYILFTSPNYKTSEFSRIVCAQLDKFLKDLKAGRRPVLILQAPPQHGKSEIVSRKFPAYALGIDNSLRVAGASYNDEFANNISQEVRRNLASPEHLELFPVPGGKRKYDVNRMGEFTAPGGFGSYLSVGVGSGLTGRPVDCVIKGTLIDTSIGRIPVEDLQFVQPSCKILAYREGYLFYERLKAFAVRSSVGIYRITTESGRILEVTGDHPIFSGNGYVVASQLTPGQNLLCSLRKRKNNCSLRVSKEGGSVLQNPLDDGWAFENDRVASIVRVCESAVTYDLQVENCHNFFANGVLVHNCGIIDDPIKDQKEAVSATTKENHWNWFQSTFLTRLSERSGIIVMATQWAEDDLPSRIIQWYQTNDPSRLTVLRFPAINSPHELNYQPQLKEGALVPELHSLAQIMEIKSLLSDYWWSALYQQSAKALGGNVFKEIGIQYYVPKDLPEKFDLVVDSWDCTFKDTDGTDYVVGQKWGKRGANSYLLRQVRARMGFTETAAAVERMQNESPKPHEILIEDKANGPAVIDFLKKSVPRLIPVEPDGSKLARAYAVTSVWESRNIFLPHPDYAPAVMLDSGKPGMIKVFTSEITIFNAGADDDQVDAMTQALRRLYPLFGHLSISKEALKIAARK